MRTWKRTATAISLIWTVAGLALAHEPTGTKVAKGTKTLWSAGEVKWAPMAGLAGAQQAVLWGDPTRGEHGILYRWPAGTNVPIHWHTHGDRGIVISGTLSLGVEGAAPKELPPGSYFSLGGGMHHTTSCKAGADCVFFLQRDGLFDVQGLPAAAPTTR
ncbi:MAG: cupin domain-containing protein [Thermoanaerobaculia bacterium]